MYEVSDDYKAIVRRSPQVYYSHLRINVSGTDYTDNDVMEGSFSINNQCSESSDVMLGGVYVGELSLVFKKNLNIPRNSWNKREIKPYYRLKLENGTYEELPLGVFCVDEATYSASGIEVKAYDCMADFDKKIVLNQSSGTPYSFLRIACNNCQVTLGMTELEVQALPNGQQTLTYYSENDVETWRDLISRVAQILGGFATIDRLGRLVIRTFSQSSVDRIDVDRRTDSSKFSDFITSYTGMSYVSLSDNYTHYHGLPDDNGLTMNIGANPFLQNGTKAYIDRICSNVLSAISIIQYTPHEVTVGGNPAFDLGDVVEYVDGLADISSICCIMSYNFSYHRGFSMKGYGKDPALSTARSKVDKDISGLLDKVNVNEIIFTTFTNAEEIEISDGHTETIINIRFASSSATFMMFQAEILGQIETSANGITYDDAKVQIHYINNGSEIQTYHPKETYNDGNHIISLMYIIPVDNNIINQWEVRLDIDGGDITIPAENIKATIYGQGLAASDEWDGIIDISDNIRLINFTNIDAINTISEHVSREIKQPSTTIMNDNISTINLTNIQVEEFSDDISVETETV